MNEAIEDLIGNIVEVRSALGQGEAADQGVLLAFDHPWIRIDKNGETLCFPVHHVRLLKLIKRLHAPAQKDVLLRPVE